MILKLALLRHGESKWNSENRFTGWTDIDLTEKGIEDEMDLAWVPVYRSWRLNEKSYGDLQGLSKAETARKYGENQVLLWRRSFDVRPPELDMTDERHPVHELKYSTVEKSFLPAAECLKDTVERSLSFVIRKEVIIMPDKDGTGPKGQGPKDGKGKGKGNRTGPGQGPMTGGKEGVKKTTKK